VLGVPVQATPARTAPALATQTQPAKQERSLLASPWFWTGVGAAVVAGAAVAGFLILKQPSTSDIPQGNAGAVTFASPRAR
jgi:hypothetical protein